MTEQAHFRKRLFATSSQQAGGRLAAGWRQAGSRQARDCWQQVYNKQATGRVTAGFAASSQEVETQATGTNNRS